MLASLSEASSLYDPITLRNERPAGLEGSNNGPGVISLYGDYSWEGDWYDAVTEAGTVTSSITFEMDMNADGARRFDIQISTDPAYASFEYNMEQGGIDNRRDYHAEGVPSWTIYRPENLLLTENPTPENPILVHYYRVRAYDPDSVEPSTEWFTGTHTVGLD